MDISTAILIVLFLAGLVFKFKRFAVIGIILLAIYGYLQYTIMSEVKPIITKQMEQLLEDSNLTFDEK